MGTLDKPIAKPHMNGDDQERHYDGPREYQDFQHVQGEIEHKGGTDPNAYESPNDYDPLGESGQGGIPLSPPTPRYSGYRGSAGRFPRPVPR